MNHLDLPQPVHSVDFLNQFLVAYTRNVPWESATRNVRRVERTAPSGDVDQCPRWPDEFWTLALADKTGGTCFETNLALFSMLQLLGFDCYLTINNMVESIGCHTAIVILLDGEKWLFDAGYPLECMIPLHSEKASDIKGKYLDYHATPLEGGNYEITRSRHPKPYIFTLIDQPVSVEEYKRATAEDYRPEGNFNAAVVINKIVDEKMIRFSTRPDDLLFEAFTADPEGGLALREEIPVEEDLAAQLANLFDMPEATLVQALEIVQHER
ncbi:MAG: arylamine N-acetyltransferase [Anaerolineae bacterium]